MASLKYTRPEVIKMCNTLQLTITHEDATGCVAKKDNAIYRFEYISEAEKNERLSEMRKRNLEYRKATEAAKTTVEPVAVTAEEEEAPKKKRGRRPAVKNTADGSEGKVAAAKKKVVKKKTVTRKKKEVTE